MENNEHQLNIEYCQKIEKLIKPFFQKSYERYIQIKDEIDYIIEGFPEFQMPKREIEICLLLGLDQAAITLLNHLVEKYLKTALIFRNSETNNEQSSVVETLQQSSKSAFEKYDGMELCSSINTACKQKLITKDDKEKLHRIRDCLRNAYAHAEQKKIHGNTKVPLTGLKFENDQLKVEPPRTVNIFEILPIAGLLVQKHAEANAIPYYKEIVDIMKRGIPKIFQTNLNERI